MTIFSAEFLQSLPEHLLLGFQFEATRYAMGTLGVFISVWILLAPFIRSRRIRDRRPPARQIRMELLNSVRTMCVFVVLDVFIFEIAKNDVFMQYQDISEYGWLWYWASIPIAIVLHDAYFYWSHRLMHHKKFYKHTHLTHHRSHNPTPFTAYSFAVAEAAIEYAYVPVMMLFLPLHESALAIVLLIMIFKNAIAHCGYELFPANSLDNPILRQLTTVTHHDLHHEKGTGNFGFYFTWWDRWMGTEHAHYRARFEKAVQAKSATNKKLLPA